MINNLVDKRHINRAIMEFFREKAQQLGSFQPGPENFNGKTDLTRISPDPEGCRI